MDFRSDNTASVHPALLEAIARANDVRTASYGADDLTGMVQGRFEKLFGCSLEVHLVSTGTAANAIALAGAVDPWGAVLCHREAHIETDECGAPELFSGGAKLALMGGANAKVVPAAAEEALSRFRRGVHSVLPQALSLTQCTERGAVYAPEELDALAAVARAADLVVHMDGARFANAAAALGCAPRDAARGVDVLSFGASKNGAMAVEAIIVFSPQRLRSVERVRKRSGHLISKHRYLAAQMLAYLENDLWLENARRANALAQRLAEAAGDWLSAPWATNHVFIRPGRDALAELRALGALFYEWDAAGDEARLVVSWDQDEREVDALCAALTRLRRAGG